MEALLGIIRDFILEKRMTVDLLMQHYANAKEQGELSTSYANRYKGQFDAYSTMCAMIEKFLDLVREVQSDE